MSKRPMFLSKTYFPSHHDNKMHHEGDVRTARDIFLKNRFRNLDKLLKNRYSWMNDYLKQGDVIVEIGCGAGFSPLYLNEKLLLTDATKNPWVDKIIDATNIDMSDNSIDVLIASQTIHHFYSPYKFFFEALRVLKPNGFLLIQEINTSLMMRVLLRLMRHEGWSYDVDVFNKEQVVNDPHDLWSANCAAPYLLFSNEEKFIETFFNEKFSFIIKKNIVCECFLFPLSGGVIAKTKMPLLPHCVLNSVEKIDNLLCKIAPSIFGLGRSIVIQKRAVQ